MFGTALTCGIKAVKVRVQDVDGRLLRRCRVTLSHEFTEDIARTLGPDAENVREGLRNHGVERAVLPIEGIAAAGGFTVRGEGVQINRLLGLKATALAPKEEDAGATIQLEFEFAWQEDAWIFLGRHCSAVADVVLHKAQLTLPAAAGTN